ncbi:MAG: hypothetical protein HOO95_03935 [Gallionella sp.]|nr:hypothetical protein [Gallionella sp.]
MLKLTGTLQAWGTSGFEVALKQEISELHADQLPLQQGLAISNMVASGHITVLVLHTTEMDNVIRIKVGILYSGVIAGCSCADDPTPDGTNNEYCEMLLDIDKANAVTKVTLLA